MEKVGLRLNKRPPNITITTCKTGGVKLTSIKKLNYLDEKMVKNLLQEYKIHNADVLVRDDSTMDDLIDVLEGNRKYVRCLYVYNKIDTITIEEINDIAKKPDCIVISCNFKLNLDYLLEKMWEKLELVRVYTKRRG